MGLQLLRENLLRVGLLSPWSHRSCQEPAPAWASYEVTASSGHPLSLTGVCQGLLHHGPPWTAGGQPVTTGSGESKL